MRLFLLLISISLTYYSIAQSNFGVDSSEFIFLEPTPKQHLSVDFKSNLFLRNNEYFNNLYDGITFIGANFNPRLHYSFHPQINLSLGWYLRLFNGRNKNYINQIWYRLQYQFNKKLTLIMGNIIGYEQHQLIEPILSNDFRYLDEPEKGIQFLYNSNQLHLDLWVNWQKFILPNDHFKEEFLLGNTSKFNLIQLNKSSLKTSTNFLAKHKGGQVDQLGLPMQTFFNWSIGLNYAYCPKLGKQFGIESYYVQFNDASDHLLLQYKDGYGILNWITYKNKIFDLAFGYWRGEYYYSPVGEPLFQSLSKKYVAYNEAFKQLVLFKFQYKHQIIETSPLYMRFESYYDPDRGYFDFSYSLLINISERRTIFKAPTFE